MSLAEAVGGRTRDLIPYRGAVTHAERRALWVDDFEVEKECGDEPQEQIDLSPTPLSVDSKQLFLAADELPHSNNVQVNFARDVLNAFVHMMRQHQLEPAKVRHLPREEGHAEDSILLKIADLLTEITDKPTNELVERLRYLIVSDLSAHASTKVQETVLETFTGYVDQVDGDTNTAYVRLKSQEHGDILYGQYPASELASKGIYEQTRFLCETIKVGNSTRLDLKALPDMEVSEEELRAIDERIHRVIPRDDPGIEY